MIHVLKWFDKAIHRNDYYSFMKYQGEFVENFIAAAFALNRTWYADEKRLIENLENLLILPPKSADRLEELIMHRGNCTTLQGSLKTICALWNDIYKLARKEFGNINLPK